MPTPPRSSAELLDLLRKSGVVPQERLAAAVPDLATLPDDPKLAAEALIQRGVITRFQSVQLLAGRHKGFRLGPYAVLDVLGRGGMGAVYLAEHLELHRKVAIKVLVPGRNENQRLATERFLREARAAAALDHPNIVRIHDVARHNETPYLVMEYVDGQTLQQVLDRDGAVPFSSAADYIAQAASGLQHAHERGFVHRDIKPGNLIRDAAGTVKILDMGLARLTAAASDRLTEQLDGGAVLGTADFISPEQALSCPLIDIRADLYSLGATFYTLIAGKPPFDGHTAQKLLHHQVTPAPSLTVIDPTLPKGLAAVASRLLAKKPEDRYQTPAELIAALAPWLGNSTRILAGLSRTNLAQGVDLHATLQDLARGGSSRILGTVRTEPDHPSAEVDPSAVRDTSEVAAADTTRESNARPKPRPAVAAQAARRPNRWLVPVAIGVLVLAAGGITGWLAFGNTNSPPASQTQSTQPSNPSSTGQPNPNSQPPVVRGQVPEPAPAPTGTVVPPAVRGPAELAQAPPPRLSSAPIKVSVTQPTERVLFRQVFAEQKPFVVRSGLAMAKDNPSVKHYRLVSETGPGKPPAGWSARVWDVNAEMEFAAESVVGGMALSIRNVQGPGSAMLFMPKFDCPTGACRLRFEFEASVRDRKFAIRFKPNDNRPAWDVTRPAVTGSAWQTVELLVDLKGARGGFFEFHNSDESPSARLRLRGVTVTELQTPPPAPSDLSQWKEGPIVYRLDADKVPMFRVSKEKGKLLNGDAEKLPAGISCYCWKDMAVGEFRCEEVDGTPALGLTNLTDEKSAQFGFDLEGGMKLTLVPGKAYRVKLVYSARNEATGALVVHAPSLKYEKIASLVLANTGTGWRSVDVSFERREGVSARMVIDNNSVGEGNTILFRSIEIIELVPPAR